MPRELAATIRVFLEPGEPAPPAEPEARTEPSESASSDCAQARAEARAHDEPSRRLIELLKRPIASHQHAEIEARVRQVTELFRSLDPEQRAAMRRRLSDPGGALGRLFDCELHHDSRHRLRTQLDAPARAPSPTPEPPVRPSPCRRELGSMTGLLPWERAMLAVANGTRESAFDSVAVLIGPILLPGQMGSFRETIVRTALQHGYAVTIENNIWFPRPLDTSTPDGLASLVHESVHALDYATAGTEAFLKTYAMQAAVGFSHDHFPHEQRANRVEAAARRMLARFPQLTSLIVSCDSAAIVAELRRVRDVYRAALNELVDGGAPAADGDAASEAVRDTDFSLRHPLLELGPATAEEARAKDPGNGSPVPVDLAAAVPPVEPAERAKVVQPLPSVVPDALVTPPASDPETLTEVDPLTTLESRYFPPPGGTDVAPFSRTSRVEPIVDGRDYFAAIKAQVDALAEGDTWYVAGWWTHRDFVFAPGGPKLFDLLVDKASAGVDVRVIFWVNRQLLIPGVGFFGRARPFLAVVRSNIKGAEELRARTDAAGRRPLAGRVLIDWSGNERSSHHMKINVFRHDGAVVAFAGGIDYAPARLSAPGHSPAPGWHDAGTRLTGAAAQRVLATYVTRWKEASTLSAATYNIGSGPKPYNPPPITPLTAPAAGTALAASAETSTQVVRSFPDTKEFQRLGRDLRWATLPSSGVHEAKQTFQTMLRAAQRYIYVEDQAFDAVSSLFPALVDACKRGVKVIAVMPGIQDPTEGRRPAPRGLRSEVIDGLLRPLTPAQRLNVAVWQLRGTFVHAKLILIDDELMSIGSANFMDRSMQSTNDGDDSELTAVAVTTSTLVADLRVKLWAEHMRVRDSGGLADLRDLSKSLGNWRRTWGTGISGSAASRVGNRVFVGPASGALPTPVHSGGGSTGSAGSAGSGEAVPDIDFSMRHPLLELGPPRRRGGGG